MWRHISFDMNLLTSFLLTALRFATDQLTNDFKDGDKNLPKTTLKNFFFVFSTQTFFFIIFFMGF